MEIIEKILPSLIMLIASCVISGIMTLITLKISFKQQTADLIFLKQEIKDETKLLHDRISKKDIERLDDLKEIREDIKQMLISQARISGFIDNFKNGDRRQNTWAN